MSYELKISKIDPLNCSMEDLKKEILKIKSIIDEYNGLQHSIKIFINSIYGACASPFFVGYNIYAAEAVTLQGQDMIHFANSIIDDYFLNIWHKDTQLHQAMGLTKVQQITSKSLVIYNDTDSCSFDTIIKTDGGDKTIEKFYNENIINGSAGNTVSGHESVITSNKILNWSEEKSLYYAPVKRIIRHKVKKVSWVIKTKSGKSIKVTNDHSMVVFRNGIKLVIKPAEILKTDKILCIKFLEKKEFYFDEIESCEMIGDFTNEYVYDIELGDETHTFIGNDMLVHNSTYISFEPVIKSCDWKGNPVEFILQLKKIRLNPYFKQRFGEYAKRFNTVDIQNLELEKISYNALMMAKKKYILDIAWKDPGVEYQAQEKIASTGVEIVQSSTPKFARKVLKELIKYLFQKGKSLNYADAVKKLKEYKQQFILQPPDDISKGMGIGEYEKYCLEDKNKITLAEKCPINIRAAAVFNHQLQKSKWKGKYNLIKTGDKIKFYYTKTDEGIFGFLPGNFPHEFAPEIDYNQQFEKSIVDPFNRFIEALGYSPVPGNLIYCKSLF